MSKEVRTGLFAVIVLAATLFTVEYLKGKDIFSRTDTYYIIYPSVEGIDVSTAVTVGGYAAGRVSDVIYNRESGDYTVEISVSRNFPIPKDSRMDIYSSDILGTKKIKAVMGHSGTIAVSGDTLQGGIETDMLSSLAESIEPVALGLDTLVRSLNRTAESAKLILSDDNRGRIDGILQKIEDMTESLCVLADTVKGKSPEISEIISRLHSISSSLDSAAASAAVTAGLALSSIPSEEKIFRNPEAERIIEENDWRTISRDGHIGTEAPAWKFFKNSIFSFPKPKRCGSSLQ